VRLLAPFLAGQITLHRLSRLLPLWMRGSPPDLEAAQDPEFVADFFRSTRMFTTGRHEGFLREQAAIARAGKPAPFAAAARWRVLLGASDVLYEPGVVLAYWRELLPNAEFEIVPDGGRFLAMTHPHLVLEALAS
jgi:pimeloyl-ACP methyl ester carboxylesterase